MSQGPVRTSPPTLDGLWQMKSGTFTGESIPELVCRHTELRISGPSYAFTFNGEITDAGDLLWGDTTLEMSAILHCQQGANAGRRTPCNFAARGQLLRLTCAFPDAAHPAGPGQPYTALFSRLSPN